jgi:hypothetical protein
LTIEPPPAARSRDPVPVLQRGLFDGLFDLDPGCVDEDVEPALRGLEIGQDGADLVLLGYIEYPKAHAVWQVAIAPGRTRAQISHDDPRAFLGEAGADGPADPAAASGDQRGLAGERAVPAHDPASLL